jgi:D-glycero-alpha-D-manno-heptose-7-phosphate kinase
MLIARAPMRVSFAGGGTDLEAYYARYEGIVISTAINKYFYTIATTEESDDLQVISADYRSLFRHSAYDDFVLAGELPLPKAVLQHFGIYRGLNMFTSCEVPPGTGLGSSSAATVSMVRALSTLTDQPLTKAQVAETAAFIEIDKLKMPIGKQDHYASAFGGLNKITFATSGVLVEPIHIDPGVYQLLERRLLLFFTGSSRESTSILKHQRKSTEEHDEKVLQSLHKMKEFALQMQACLEKGDLDTFASLLHRSWLEKRRLVPGLSTALVDECYDLALQHGAQGGKITGAGGGGFLMLYCTEESQDELTHILENRGLKRMNFRFDSQGATVLLNVTQPQNFVSSLYRNNHMSNDESVAVTKNAGVRNSIAFSKGV